MSPSRTPMNTKAVEKDLRRLRKLQTLTLATNLAAVTLAVPLVIWLVVLFWTA